MDASGRTTARIWWVGDEPVGGGVEGLHEDLVNLRQKWRRERQDRRVTAGEHLEAARRLAIVATMQAKEVAARIPAERQEDPEIAERRRRRAAISAVTGEADEDEDEERQLARGGQGNVPLYMGRVQRLDVPDELTALDGSCSSEDENDAAPLRREGAAAARKAEDKGDVSFRLRKRRAELYRTEVHTINSLLELLERLDVLSMGILPAGSSSEQYHPRKRDVVKDALLGGVASVFGGTILSGNVLGAMKGRPPGHQPMEDPYARVSLPKGMVDQVAARKGGAVDNALWDARLLQETMRCAHALVEVHDTLRAGLESACVQDSMEPIWRSFRESGDAMQSAHLEYSKVSEKALEMLRGREPGNIHEWGDLLARPTQRVMKYQLFFDELSKDASLAGQELDGTALQSLKGFMQRLLEGIEEGRIQWECGQTVMQLVRETPGMPSDVVSMLKEQECVLCVCKAAQMVQVVRGSGRECLVDRILILFDQCLAVVDPANNKSLKLLEAIPLESLTQSSCREVVQFSATGLEVLRKYHLQHQGHSHSVFEIDGRTFTAGAAQAQELRVKLSEALLLSAHTEV